MKNLNESLELAKEIAKQVNIYGGRAYFVGGFVRDEYRYNLGQTNVRAKDIDIEIHGIDRKILENILSKFGNVIEMGKSFGIYSLANFNIDIALPRIESKNGLKHIDFDIELDPFIGTFKASKRRDFTINSVMKDILTEEYIDNFNGLKDIENGIIRYVNYDKFQEDPLRVLRACQFSARFNFEISSETIELCKKIDIRYLSKERIYNELVKGLLSKRPSIFFKNLQKMNHLNFWFKELFDLIDIKQDKRYHAEGDVYTHTLMVLDEGAKLLDRVDDKIAFMFSCLCHDFGKFSTTVIEEDRIRSLKHEEAGVEIAKKFLKRITNEKKIIKYVINMTLLHMRPNIYARDNSKIRATNKLFFESINPNDLILLSMADDRGRISEVKKDDTEKYLFDRLNIFYEYMNRDYVTGHDLIKSGIKPGINFNKLLKLRDKHRISGVSKKDSLAQIIYYNKKLDNC